MHKSLLLGIFLFYYVSAVYSQETDSTQSIVVKNKDLETKVNNSSISVDTSGMPRPLKATLLSAALPGAGQVYNGKIWKVPIIYGAAAGLIYSIDYNQNQYTQFRESLIYKQEKEDKGFSNRKYHFEDTTLSEYTLRQEKDDFKKKRDRSIIYLVVLYALNVIDANVDAHLQDFKVDDNLTMMIKPDYYIDRKTLTIGFNYRF